MISRRDLYAAGLPLGDGATRRKLGGGLVCGFGGDSSQQTTSETVNNTEYTDSRMVTDGASVGINSGGGAVQSNYTTYTTATDSGALEAGRDISLAGLTVARDTSITALNDNATNTAALVAAVNTMGAQQIQALALNTSLASDIASAGFGAASAQSASNTANFRDLLDAGISMFKVNNAATSRNLDLTEHLADGAASAYANAAAEATGSKKLIVVGIAAVAIVAAFALIRK